MILETERLRLRPLREKDAADFTAYRRDPEVARYQSWDTGYSLTDAIEFIREIAGDQPGTPGKWFQFAIADKESDDLLGDIGVHFDEKGHGDLMIGFTLSSDHQGKGIAAEAVSALIADLKRRFLVQKLYAYTDVRNKKSQALLERLGFVRSREIKKSGFYKGEWCDEFLYEMTQYPPLFTICLCQVPE
ncbi:MAG: N-acetyltransferase [Alphaproteobacteria bacterium]|nr:MAG: N-acetyltransferase [Alphaproteobacteria bacterium]